MAQRNAAPRHVASLAAGVHRVRVQLQLDVDDRRDRPRPIAAAITDFLGENLPAPAEAADLLLELDATERATWYRMANIPAWRCGEYEDAYRRRLARQYRRRKTA